MSWKEANNCQMQKRNAGRISALGNVGSTGHAMLNSLQEAWSGSLGRRTPERAELLLKSQKGDFPGGPVALILPPNVGGLGSILGQGTRYYMPQLRSRILQLRSRIPQLRSRLLQLRPGALK